MVSRRRFLTSTAVLAVGATTLHSRAMGADHVAAEPTPATPADALERLRAGNARFAAGEPIAPHRDLARLRALAPKQAPYAAVLACADSRVPVEILYDQGFGNLFVVRVAGNVATSVEIASLEYGTLILGAKALIVLGHSSCGAVDAALKGGEVPGQISTLYQHIAPALDRKTMSLASAVLSNVRYQARRLRTGSTVIPRLVKDGQLQMAGGVFELKTGVVKMVEL